MNLAADLDEFFVLHRAHGGEGGEQESATRDGVHGRWGRQAGSRLRDLSGHRDRDLAPPMGEVDVEGALDVGGVLGIHSDTDGV